MQQRQQLVWHQRLLPLQEMYKAAVPLRPSARSYKMVLVGLLRLQTVLHVKACSQAVLLLLPGTPWTKLLLRPLTAVCPSSSSSNNSTHSSTSTYSRLLSSLLMQPRVQGQAPGTVRLPLLIPIQAA